MAVYGFCMILKQLNYSNSQRAQFNLAVSFTQHTISGYSLMSQMPGSRNRSNSQHHFDMLIFEIIGSLRSCLQLPVDLKVILYESKCNLEDSSIALCFVVLIIIMIDITDLI